MVSWSPLCHNRPCFHRPWEDVEPYQWQPFIWKGQPTFQSQGPTIQEESGAQGANPWCQNCFFCLGSKRLHLFRQNTQKGTTSQTTAVMSGAPIGRRHLGGHRSTAFSEMTTIFDVLILDDIFSKSNIPQSYAFLFPQAILMVGWHRLMKLVSHRGVGQLVRSQRLPSAER